MKKYLFISLLSSLFIVIHVGAANVKSGDLWYNIYYASGNKYTAQVAISDGAAYSGEITIPYYINYQGQQCIVKKIERSAFQNCTGLTKVTVNACLDAIEMQAFEGCSNLESVSFGCGVKKMGYNAFNNCTSLKTITIPTELTAIPHHAFSNCSSLTTVVIRDNVTSIGNGAFSGCVSLNTIEIPNSVTNIEGAILSGCIALTEPVYNNTLFVYMPTSFAGQYTIPNGIENIVTGAFVDCDGLTSVTLPEGIITVSDSAFCSCDNLASVVLPRSLSTLGKAAFRDCKGLTSVAILEGLTEVSSRAFLGCENLSSVILPESITTIESDAFKMCTSLMAEIPENVTTIGKSAFYYVPNVVYNSTATGEPWGAKCVNGYVEGWLVFNNSSKTELLACSSSAQGNVIIPNSVTTIGENAFRYCNSITSVDIPNTVTTIGADAFSDCPGLLEIIVPSSVISIGSRAFKNVSNVVYSGSAYGSPWEAKCVNGFVDGWLVYSNFEKEQLLACYTSAKEISIPNTVTSISNKTFAGCNQLQSVIWDTQCETVQFSTAKDIIAEFTFGNNVEGVLPSICSGMSNLHTLVIGKYITGITENAFDGCSNLKQIKTEATTPPEIPANCFPADVIVYVPAGSLQSYKQNSQWRAYRIHLSDLMKLTIDVASTSVAIQIGDDINSIAHCGIVGGDELDGNIAEFIGLEPESEFKDVHFYVKSIYDDYDLVDLDFTTTSLLLTTQPSQPVSSTTAILLAQTNMADIEVSCGFEYKRNDAPEDMAATKVFAPVANGMMAGRLKGLNENVYYKYRAFYKSAADSMFYGDWQYIFTGDVAVEFDPILYTYAATAVTDTTATVKGYALAGSEDFTEQGFEYWSESRVSQSDNAPVRLPAALGEHKTVTASGISMKVTLTDLDEGTVYKYRTYAKIGNRAVYGSEMTFTTQGEYTGTEDIETIISTPDTRARKILLSGQLLILRGEKVYTTTGQEVR